MSLISTSHHGHRYLYYFPSGQEHMAGAQVETDWQAGKLPACVADALLDQLEVAVDARVKAARKRRVTVNVDAPPMMWLDKWLEWAFPSECSGK